MKNKFCGFLVWDMVVKNSQNSMKNDHTMTELLTLAPILLAANSKSVSEDSKKIKNKFC